MTGRPGGGPAYSERVEDGFWCNLSNVSMPLVARMAPWPQSEDISHEGETRNERRGGGSHPVWQIHPG